MEYNCKKCNYITIIKRYWVAHCKTKKHLNKNIKYSKHCKKCDYHTNNRNCWYAHCKTNKHNKYDINIFNKESIFEYIKKGSFEELYDNVSNDYYTIIYDQLYLFYVKNKSNNTIKYTNLRSNICSIHIGENKWEKKNIDTIFDIIIKKVPLLIKTIIRSAPMIYYEILIPQTVEDLDNQSKEDKLLIINYLNDKEKQIEELETKNKVLTKIIKNKIDRKRLNEIKRKLFIDIYNIKNI